MSVVIASTPITYIVSISISNTKLLFNTKLPSLFQYGLLVYTELKFDGFLMHINYLRMQFIN